MFATQRSSRSENFPWGYCVVEIDESANKDERPDFKLLVDTKCGRVACVAVKGTEFIVSGANSLDNGCRVVVFDTNRKLHPTVMISLITLRLSGVYLSESRPEIPERVEHPVADPVNKCLLGSEFLGGEIA